MTIKQQGGIFGRNPTFNDLTAGSGSSIEGSGENITFSVNRTDASTAGALVLRAASGSLSIDSDGANKDILIRTGGSTERARFYGDSGDFSIKGNLIVDSGQGIDFSATSGTGTSELFDDYEEGTWTPAIEIYGTSGTYTATTSGIYTKVGNLVTVSGRLINVTESVAGGADYFKITGLPFTDIAGYSAVGSVSLGNWNVPACYNAFVTFDSTGARDYVIMGLNVDNGATDYLDKTHLVSGTSDIEFTISYFT